MLETAKVNYVQYGRSTKSKKKKPQSSVGATGPRGQVVTKVARWPQGIQWQITQMSLLSHLTPATDVGKGNITRHRTARLWTLLARGSVARKGIMKRFACRVNGLHTLWRHHRLLQQGLEPVNP